MRADGSSGAVRPRILFLGGAGRSGSTLLERTLGSVPGVSAAGELVHLWERGVAQDERCGCGQNFADCAFWSAVGERAYDGWHNVDLASTLALRREVDRTRKIPLLLAPRLWPGYRVRLNAWVHQLGRLYDAIWRCCDGDVVVDSSKHASYAFLLRRLDVDLRVVLVVRDSRGVAYSWAKKVRKPEVQGSVAYMPRYSPARTSALWLANNLAVDLLRLTGVPVLVLRYEELLEAPVQALDRVLAFAGVQAGAAVTPHSQGATVDLSTDHTVAGNPMRFTAGRVELRLDEEWRQRMGRRDRLLVTLLTGVALRRYGYLRTTR